MSKLKRKGLHLNSSLMANAVITNKSIYGANHIVVEGAGSIICDTVMNDIYYTREEVEKLADSTNGDIHAPSGHPEDEKGNFISAGHPMATQQNFIGGISNNYRMSGDRLVRDIAINPEIANRSDDGKEIIKRIENNEDTDTSTGLLLSLEEKSGIGNDGEPYKYIARNMELDHDAILLRERGAATSLQGVGMFANSKGDEFGVDEYTINASVPAMNLPLASSDHVWNESEALERVKTFTNSTDKPSSNFRRFFLNFDQSNVDSFDSYTNLFADIIDGKPHAVKSPIESAKNNKSAKKYNERFANNKDGILSKAWNVIKSVFMGNRDLSHDDINNKIHQKLNEGRSEDNRHLWPMEIFDDKFVYRADNDTMRMQSYALVDNEVVFIGESTKVERVVEYKTVTNNGGDMITNGAKLSAKLKSLLDKESGGDSDKRSELIDDMASAAGITRDTTLAILANDIDVPPDNRLEGFAKVLGVSFESLKSLVPKTQTNGDRIMREKLIKALNAKGVKTEGLDDDAIFAAFNKLHDKDDKNLTEEEILKRKKDKEKQKNNQNDDSVLSAINALGARMDKMQSDITENADSELNKMAKQIGELKKGITEEVAKGMGANACKKFLAANGVVAFNTGNSNYQHNNKIDGVFAMDMPGAEGDK